MPSGAPGAGSRSRPWPIRLRRLRAMRAWSTAGALLGPDPAEPDQALAVEMLELDVAELCLQSIEAECLGAARSPAHLLHRAHVHP